MKTIAVLNLKGGCGKTTIVVHTAVAAQEAGQRVLIIDTDPQKSAWKWSQHRKQETPLVIAQPVYELAGVLQAAEQDGITLAIVDTAPALTAEAAQVVSMAGLTVIPIRPTAFDLEAAMESIRMVTALRAEAVLVLSACPTRAPEIAEAREVLAKLPLWSGQITDRRAFARAVASGRTVTEFETDGKAAVEIRELWKWLTRRTK